MALVKRGARRLCNAATLASSHAAGLNTSWQHAAPCAQAWDQGFRAWGSSEFRETWNNEKFTAGPCLAATVFLRHASTAAPSAVAERDFPGTTSDEIAVAPSPSPLDFQDHKLIFNQKGTLDLLRMYIVLRACTFRTLVQNADAILSFGKLLLGERLVYALIKQTFFQQFCAGEDEKGIRSAVDAFRARGIGAILDFAAEDDVNPAKEVAKEDNKVVVARTYDYLNEKKCDEHVNTFLNAIGTVARLPGQGFAAIKVTALGNPALLERVSGNLVEIHELFKRADLDGSKTLDRNEFEAIYKQLFRDADDEELKIAFDKADLRRNNQVDYISWAQQLPLTEMPQIVQRMRKMGLTRGTPSFELAEVAIDDAEVALLEAMINRVRILAEAAAKQNVKLMLDAEHSYFQPGIDHVVKELQRAFNREKPVIFNTYQCYLKDCKERLLEDMERAKRQGYKFAAKLVRGAYLQLERQRAQAMGYESPVLETLEQTHESYNTCMEAVLQAVRDEGAEVMIATHNQRSVELCVAEMQRHSLEPLNSGVYFGQLMGMSDNLTFTLGVNHYQAFKYVPFGPVPLVMPYLIRRAQENSDIMGGGVASQLTLIQHEIKRRVFG